MSLFPFEFIRFFIGSDKFLIPLELLLNRFRFFVHFKNVMNAISILIQFNFLGNWMVERILNRLLIVICSKMKFSLLKYFRIPIFQCYCLITKGTFSQNRVFIFNNRENYFMKNGYVYESSVTTVQVYVHNNKKKAETLMFFWILYIHSIPWLPKYYSLLLISQWPKNCHTSNLFARILSILIKILERNYWS